MTGNCRGPRDGPQVLIDGFWRRADMPLASLASSGDRLLSVSSVRSMVSGEAGHKKRAGHANPSTCPDPYPDTSLALAGLALPVCSLNNIDN